MKLLSLTTTALGGLLLASCAGSKKENPSENLFAPIDYTLTVTNIEGQDSTYIYLCDYDSLAVVDNMKEAVIDSVLVTGNQAVFNVKGSTSPVVVIPMGNYRHIIFPEAGENTFNMAEERGSGELSGKFVAYMDSIKSVYANATNLPDDENSPEFKAYVDSVQSLRKRINDEIIENNKDNALGFYLITTEAAQNLETVDSIIAKYPQFADTKRMRKVREEYEKLKATSPGQPYTDFTIESHANGKTVKLSDYIKPDRYTLVDFWASWCGPCKRAIKGLKENYAELNAKGLDIVGVAVWESPEDTQNWLKENPLPWQIILDAQKVPTDLYSVSGIPTLILIAPDGKIIARSHSDEEILEAFNAAIAK